MSIFSISDMMINRCITIYSLVAALTAGAIPAASAQKDAGTSLPGSLDFLNVTDVRLFTSYVIEDGYPVAWGGDGFHAGIQAFSFILSNCKEIPREFDMPTDPSSFLQDESELQSGRNPRGRVSAEGRNRSRPLRL